MARWGLVLLLGAAFLLGCTQEAKLEPRVIMHPNKSIWKKWSIQRTPQGDTLIQGPYKEFYWDGSPSQSTEYKDGLRQGSSDAWYENGKSKWTKMYDQNKKVGIWRLYSANGYPNLEVHFAEGLMDGSLKIWDVTDSTSFVEAQFTKGQCSGGACNALDSVRNVKGSGADNRRSSLITAFLE